MTLNNDWVLIWAGVITGMMLIALILLCRVMAQMGRLSGSRSVQPEPTAISAPAAAQNTEVSDEVVAVITAAIAAMTGSGNFVVRSIRPAACGRSAWAMAGLNQNVQTF